MKKVVTAAALAAALALPGSVAQAGPLKTLAKASIQFNAKLLKRSIIGNAKLAKCAVKVVFKKPC
ncbi:MAG: hypothetical protein AB7E80_09640 [Hyphomicrobiaceae bacterium]